MPQIKIDHVVSFSSEDSVCVASNILSSDLAKKWKCSAAGEKAATVVLQLEKASIISSIDIGNEHSAYIEVLVGRSSAEGDFKVLLIMSSFMTPLESRQSTNTNKVRMFTQEELQKPESEQKWDRIKIICTQPFNRHVKYGLAFITLHSPSENILTSVLQPTLGKFTIRPESPDNLSAGSLFAKRNKLVDDITLTGAAAIRQASTTAVSQRNLLTCKPKLKGSETTPSKQNLMVNQDLLDTPRPRNRNDLLYKDDEEQPNGKIDKIIEQNQKETKKKENKDELANSSKKTGKKHDRGENNTPVKDKNKTVAGPSRKIGNKSPETNKRKPTQAYSSSKKAKLVKRTKPFNQLLSDVVLVISGIQNPDRGNVRTMALELGAKYKSDWDGICTHLICAFPNTPKFNQVRGKGKIVTKDWIKDCHSQRKRLPWRRYALDRNDKGKDESEEEVLEQVKRPQRTPSPNLDFVNIDDGTDTEDEIERIQSLQKTKATTTLKAKEKQSEKPEEKEDDVYTIDTDEENVAPQNNVVLKELPNFFSSKIFYVDKEFSDKDQTLLLKYITAFNGILVNEPSDVVDIAITSRVNSETLQLLCPEAKLVSADWVWECHNTGGLVPIEQFNL